jgi:hypothetical protein
MRLHGEGTLKVGGQETISLKRPFSIWFAAGFRAPPSLTPHDDRAHGGHSHFEYALKHILRRSYYLAFGLLTYCSYFRIGFKVQDVRLWWKQRPQLQRASSKKLSLQISLQVYHCRRYWCVKMIH